MTSATLHALSMFTTTTSTALTLILIDAIGYNVFLILVILVVNTSGGTNGAGIAVQGNAVMTLLFTLKIDRASDSVKATLIKGLSEFSCWQLVFLCYLLL